MTGEGSSVRVCPDAKSKRQRDDFRPVHHQATLKLLATIPNDVSGTTPKQALFIRLGCGQHLPGMIRCRRFIDIHLNNRVFHWNARRDFYPHASALKAAALSFELRAYKARCQDSNAGTVGRDTVTVCCRCTESRLLDYSPNC